MSCSFPAPALTRRRVLMTSALVLPGLPGQTLMAATPAVQADLTAMAAFDGLYIPVLFLTGSAGKSPEGPARAMAALQRLKAEWPARRAALSAALPAGGRVWMAALQAVDGHLAEGARQVDAQRWESSHEAMERVRAVLFTAREHLGVDYALDRFTAFHGAMEKVATVTTVQRLTLAADFAQARVHWRRIEQTPIDPAVFGLSAARQAQLQSALVEETQALSRLSTALREADDTTLLKAAAAIKPPFIKAYVAFGWLPGEMPVPGRS